MGPRRGINRKCCLSGNGRPRCENRRYLVLSQCRAGYRGIDLWIVGRYYREKVGVQSDLFDHFCVWASYRKYQTIHLDNLPTFIQAAPKYNYEAVCGIYFLASLGLGGNIPIDATIALEFLPQSRRNLVALLSLWQPVGVVAASGIAYGTAAKYRCDVELPSCRAVGEGEACCTVSSNMGWRYEVIVLGFVTLLIFFLRFFVFTFHESPKFLLSRGNEAEAIEVLHKIAKFNRAPPPTLTLDMFAAINEMDSKDSIVRTDAPKTRKEIARNVGKAFAKELKRLKGIFANKLQLFIFILLAIAYMVSLLVRSYSQVADRSCSGRLLVVQSCRLFPSHYSTTKQRIRRPWLCIGHIPTIHHHLLTWNNRRIARFSISPDASSRSQMVACVLSHLPGSSHGYVYSS